MPRRRSSTRQVRRTTELKNLIRGSATGVGGLSAAREKASLEELRNLAPWIKKTFPLNPLVKALKPARQSDILPGIFLEPVHLEKELEWVLSVFRLFRNELTFYLATKPALQDALLRGQSARASAILDELDVKCGSHSQR